MRPSAYHAEPTSPGRPPGLPGAFGANGGNARTGAPRRIPEDRRRDEDHELAIGVDGGAPCLEEPAEDRNVADERHLVGGLHFGALVDSADHEGLAFPDDDLGLG